MDIGALSLAEDDLWGLDQMADAIGRYWFVAAVFRDPKDFAETVEQMRAGGLTGRICVVANHSAEDARKAADGTSGAKIGIVKLNANGELDRGDIAGEPLEMRTLLEAMDGGEAADTVSRDGSSRPHVYTQLQDDVREGALVLLASVDGPDDQVVGARLLLKGNCECVLTHEIKAPKAS